MYSDLQNINLTKKKLYYFLTRPSWQGKNTISAPLHNIHARVQQRGQLGENGRPGKHGVRPTDADGSRGQDAGEAHGQRHKHNELV